MVWAVIAVVFVSSLGLGAFFFLPSSAFGLPDNPSDEVVTEDEETSPVLDDFFGDTPNIDSAEPVVADSAELLELSDNRAVVGQPYDGTLSSTYVDLGRDCLWGLKWFDNYVYWRSGQYSYTFAYGDISFSDGVFSSDSCTILYINAPISYSGALSVSSRTDSLSLNTGGKLVYSNLGDFPMLDSRKYIYDEVMYIAVVALGLHVLSSASSFILRPSAGSDRAD